MPGSTTSARPSSSGTGSPAVEAGREGGPAGVEGPPGRPRDHRHALTPRPRRMWTGTWRRWRTRSGSRRGPAGRGGDRPVHARDRRGHPRAAAADGRHFDVDHHQVSFAGTSLIHGELDLADALDLDAAVGARAAQLKDLGCTESLDVRRAMAVGELARRQLALDLPPATPTVVEAARQQPSRSRSAPRWCCTCTCTSPPSRAPAGRAGGEHPQPGHRRTDPGLVRQPRRPGDREAGDRPGRPRPRRGLRGPRPDRRTRRPARRDLRVPLVQPTRPTAPAR